ncbi:MAG TPA: hypothetical protein VF486_01675 [Actinomycetes bacterium]
MRPTARELVRAVPRAVQRLGAKAPAVRATARLGHDGEGVQADAGASVDGSVAAAAGLTVKRPSASSAPVAKRDDATAGVSANLGTSGDGAGVDAEAALATRGRSLNTSAAANLGATGRDAPAAANLGVTAAANSRTRQLDTTVDAKAAAAKGDDTAAGTTTDLSTTGNGATTGFGVSAALTHVKQGGTAASAAADLVASEATDTCACDSSSRTGAGGAVAAGTVRPLLARPLAGPPQAVDQVVDPDQILDGVQVGKVPADLGLGRLGDPLSLPELPARSSDPGRALPRDPSSLAAELLFGGRSLVALTLPAVRMPRASAVPELDAARLTTPPSCI